MEEEKIIIESHKEQVSQEVVEQESQTEKVKNKSETDRWEDLFLETLVKTAGVIAASFLAIVIGATLYLIYKFVCFVFVGLFSLCVSGYDKWFGDLQGYEVGRNGIVYVYEDNVLMKKNPNRVVLKNIDDIIHRDKDTIGIVRHSGTYDLLNLNNAKYITNKEYDYIWCIDDKTCCAFKNDTLYTLDYTTGNVQQFEYNNEVYYQLVAICRDGKYEVYQDEEIDYVDKESVIVYVYTNYNQKMGLMNREFKKLTPAIYTDIIPCGQNAFFCVFGDSDNQYNLGMGILLNAQGEKIE